MLPEAIKLRRTIILEQQVLEEVAYKLDFEHRASYLYVYATGNNDSIETCLGLWKDTFAEAKAHNYNKILVEKKMEGINSISEIREAINELADHIDNEYIAFIDNHPEHRQINRLTEMSASNVGLQVKFFSTIGEAKEWLLLK